MEVMNEKNNVVKCELRDDNVEALIDIQNFNYFENFLKFEKENSWLWDYEFNGIHFWPIIRTNNIFGPYYYQEMKFTEAHAPISVTNIHNSLKRNLNQILNATFYNPFLTFKHPQIIAISGARFRIERKGVWFDSIYDYVREVENDMIIVSLSLHNF